ncbi:hypothetical protein [Kitasatospora mediocidica]|uniref:hypothetical protein n=1 Tax=Kitasatospora mediocidica TaxID=58352 RepID=UPI0005694E66|nr:hypothetical protein [Kitasatospora mediocidica]
MSEDAFKARRLRAREIVDTLVQIVLGEGPREIGAYHKLRVVRLALAYEQSTDAEALRDAAEVLREATYGRGGLSDFYVSRSDRTEMIEANEEFERLKKALWAELE